MNFTPYHAKYFAHELTRRCILVIVPSNLRKQWYQELTEKFFLPCRILESKSYNTAVKQGRYRTLLVLCTAFRGRGEYPNLTVKKIPKAVLARCEWGHDDYSLRVENLPKAPPKLGQQSLFGNEGDE